MFLNLFQVKQSINYNQELCGSVHEVKDRKLSIRY